MAQAIAPRQDGPRGVRVEVIAGGKRLITEGMLLGRLLDNVEFLHFSLFCDGGAAGGFTSLRCNGRPCWEAAAPASCPRPDRQPPRALAAPGRPPLADDIPTVPDDTPACIPQVDGPPAIDVAPAVTPQADEGHTADEVAPACTPQVAWPTVMPPASTIEANDGAEVTDVAAATTTQSCRGRVTRRRTARKTPRRTPQQQEPPRGAPTPPYTLVDAFLDGTAIIAVAASSILAFYTFW